MTFIVDSHCHLNYGSLVEDMDGVLERADAAGVGTMLAINARLSEFEDVLNIAKAHDHIWATVGSHPHDAEDEWGVTPEQLIKMAEHRKVVGIGETGLDYFYEHAPRDKQKQNFIAHIEASRETGLPLIVHARDADDDRCGPHFFCVRLRLAHRLPPGVRNTHHAGRLDLRRIDEVDPRIVGGQRGDQTRGRALAEQLVHRIAAALAVVQCPLVDVHTDKLVGQIAAHVPRPVERELYRLLAVGQRELDRVEQDTADLADLFGVAAADVPADAVPAQRQRQSA